MRLGRIALAGALCTTIFVMAALWQQARVRAVKAWPANLAALPASVSGRVVRLGPNDYQYQWPGIYFEAAFSGKRLYFRVGPGEVILRVVVDAVEAATLVKPAPGWYLIDNLAARGHTVRIEVATESQAGANRFGGFALPVGAQALPAPRRARQIEFIGDSHTVGYGNTSTTRDCTEAQVWASTDNTQSPGAVTARHYQADYRIHAISGRGVVRNYNGGAGATLPAAYPYPLFDQATPTAAALWKPQLIVISLGTNDFSTALNAGEKWKSRDALRADYQAGYVAFVRALRARNPQAHFILWAIDGVNGEIQAQSNKVVAGLRAEGENKVSFMALHGLQLTGCHSHPSVADAQAIARALIRQIEAHPVFVK